MKMKYVFLILALGFLVQGLFAQRLTRVGIVDLNRIMQSYYFETAQLREIERRKAEVEEQQRRMIADIDELKERLVTARAQENQNEILRLEQLVKIREDNLREYHSVQTNMINRRIADLQNSQNLSANILRAIEQIAEEKGFSLILNAQDPRIIWHNTEVDITQDVLNRLK